MDLSESIHIPGVPDAFSLRLPPEIAAQRDRALAVQQAWGPSAMPIPERTLCDARAWAAHGDDEPWLAWRARRCAERLRSLPLEIDPGERLVGRFRFREPTLGEAEQLEEARRVLESMPPYPGGDAGHFHPDYERLFKLGIGGLLREVEAHRQEARLDAEAQTFYDACQIALEGMSAYVRRVGEACAERAGQEEGERARWLELASICAHVATEPPETLYQALQLLFMTQIALWFGEDHALTAPGRLDQTLARLYDADLAAGRLTRRAAFELLCCLYIQMNRILHIGSAISVLVGGRDAQGQDATHELTYLCLAARLATRLSYPTVAVAWHEGTPAELIDFSIRMLAQGTGDPAFFNDPLIVQGLREHGVSTEDSYNYMNSTCVEIKVVGRSNMWVTAPYFNLAQGLLDVMQAVARGEVPEPRDYPALEARVREQLGRQIDEAAARLDQVWRDRAERGGFPLASCFTRDCLERGRDFDRGGARYNWVENSFVGLANLVDSLLALRHLVYERGELSLVSFYEILSRDFEGQEAMRQRILHALPKYGNDREEPDALARQWAEFLIERSEANTVGPHRYVPGFFCWVMHERLGSLTGATPDGRRAFWPLADGAGAAQGRETQGPTASALSTTAWSHQKVLGGLVHNLKLPRAPLQREAGRQTLRTLIETYLRRGGFEIQVNVVDQETLLDAQRHPEAHSDLLVRVAGYSDYFVTLNRKMQDEIIARTEHSV